MTSQCNYINSVSPSAKGVAYLRYLEERVSKDTLAKYFCDEEGKEIAEKWLKWCPYVGRTVAVRGRYVEDMIAEQIDNRNINQVINIAAGLNTFPYRHSKAKKLIRYAELDLLPMLEFKKSKIKQLTDRGIIATPQFLIKYFPMNLSSDDFSVNFKAIDWEWRKSSVYVFEGVSYYLPFGLLQTVMDTFTETMVKGSILIMDYFPDYVKNNRELQMIMDSIPRDGGEQCLTYLGETDIPRLLGRFNIISDQLESDLEKKFYSSPIAKPIGSIIVAEM